MSNRKSSIDWLVDQINVARKLCDDPSMEMDIWHTLDVLIKKGEQAKEMHKEEIIEAFSLGDNQQGFENEAVDYYNETFGE